MWLRVLLFRYVIHRITMMLCIAMVLFVGVITYATMQILMIWPPYTSMFWHLFGVIGFVLMSFAIFLNWSNQLAAPNHPLLLHGEYLIQTGIPFVNALVAGSFYSWWMAIPTSSILSYLLTASIFPFPREITTFIPIIPLYGAVIIIGLIFVICFSSPRTGHEVIERNSLAYEVFFYAMIICVILTFIWRAQP